MDRRELEEIERFLASVGKSNLFGYYGLAPETPVVELEEAIKKRRNWAQGQQSNPKFKSEAMFLIKSNNLLRRVLLDDGDSYREHVFSSHNHRNLDVITLFIRGTLTAGVLTPQAEAAIHHQGRQLELSEAIVAQRIDEVLHEVGGRRSATGGGDDDISAESQSVDFYELLGVPNTANLEQIEAAYRSRYRWARSLKDLPKSAEVLQALDEGWRILKDPAKRQKYDAIRLEMQDVTDEVERRSQQLLGLLGAPTDPAPGSQAPGPSAPLPPPITLDPPAMFMPTPAPPVQAPPVQAPPESPAPPPSLRSIAPVPSRPAPAAPAAPEPSQRASAVAPGFPVPAPAAQISGRTLNMSEGPQPVRLRGPRLQVDGPDSLSFRMGRRTLRHDLTIHNVGQGKMPARITSDRDWLEVLKPRLEPLVASQMITLALHPDRMPWGRSSGTLSIITDHGERKAIPVTVVRRSAAPFVLGAALAVFILGLSIGAIFVLLPQATPAPVVASLLLSVDPPAEHILVNDQDRGGGEKLVIPDPSPGEPFRLRIQADGFADHEELVTLKAGQPLVRDVSLTLEDPMSWAPPRGSAAVELGEAAENAVRAHELAFGRCFADETVVPEADYVLLVSPEGRVLHVDVDHANYDLEKAIPCVKRVFRGTRLPTFAGDYGRLAVHLASPPVAGR